MGERLKIHGRAPQETNEDRNGLQRSTDIITIMIINTIAIAILEMIITINLVIMSLKLMKSGAASNGAPI